MSIFMSKRRFMYIVKESMSSFLYLLAGSLVLTGIVLLVGIVFKQEWAFSFGIFFILFIWYFFKSIYNAIKNSRGM